MAVDLFHSRRANYFKCEYWVRDERDISGTPEEWVLYNTINGYFYAKPVSNKQNSMNIINNAWALNNNRITIETDDDIENMDRGSLVRFNNQLWLVESVSKMIHLKETEFSNKIHYRHTIELVRG